ncbi:MAG TPA: chloride channel protein [Actinomycetota bacterium]|jgi:H+/Cl- antiporter ClcA/CBS domain-containing protein|nr:chloride channel protein [Actinomycetota bacterium]
MPSISYPRSSTGRIAALSLVAAPIGVLGALSAWVLVKLIGLLTSIALFQQVSTIPPPMSDLHPGPWLFLVAAAGGLVVSLIARWVPTIRGHGIPEAMEAVVERQSVITVPTAIGKPASASIAIGTGGPFGAEGPIVVTGSAIGSLLGQILPVSPAERRILLACGAAAGTAGIFGTPFAAVLLPLELLLFEFSTRSLVPLFVAAAVATAIRAGLLNGGPFVPQVTFTPPHGLDLLWYVALGIVCGLLAVLICKGLFWIEGGYRKLPISEFWHPIIGALGFAAVGMFEPRVLGVGYAVIGAELAGTIVGGALLALAVAKLLAWWVALGSGTSGGTLAPLLFIGGAFGGWLGSIAVHAGIPVDPRAFALVAMAAVFGASTRAVLTAIVFMIEIVAAPSMAVPLMLATAAAAIVATSLASDSLMTEKLTRRGLRIHHHAEVDVLRSTRVADVMSRDVVTIDAGATIAAARAVLADGPHSAYPLVTADGTLEGIVSRSDLLADGVPDTTSVEEIAASDVVAVSPAASVLDALETIVREGVEHVPVVKDGHLVGICTRTDVLRARARKLNEERPAPSLRLHRS